MTSRSDDAFLGRLFVSDVEESHAAERAHQEDDVKPAMVEVELQVTEHLCYDHSETTCLYGVTEHYF